MRSDSRPLEGQTVRYFDSTSRGAIGGGGEDRGRLAIIDKVQDEDTIDLRLLDNPSQLIENVDRNDTSAYWRETEATQAVNEQLQQQDA